MVANPPDFVYQSYMATNALPMQRALILKAVAISSTALYVNERLRPIIMIDFEREGCITNESK